MYDGLGRLATWLDTLGFVKRVHRRLFAVNDEIERIDHELSLATAELEYHRSLNDDAQRDAAVGNYIDREEAGLTQGDVRRFERTIATLRDRREVLLRKRHRLLDRLPD